ncbi:MAG: nucleoside kinase [Synechococcus sp. MED850]|jgi:uridine kinase|nr:nucleoside kinase [Synechococcus sp. MED850]
MAAGVPVFCICGPSAAGKSFIAAALAESLVESGIRPLLIACDDYYRNDWVPHPLFGYDTVEAIDVEALRCDLDRAVKREASDLRLYDMRSRQVSRRSIPSPYDVILLEGSYGPQALVGCFPFAGLFYVDESIPLRLFRRLRRDVRERHRPPGYVIRQMLSEMLPGERAFIRPLRLHADVVVKEPTTAIPSLRMRIKRALALDLG